MRHTPTPRAVVFLGAAIAALGLLVAPASAEKLPKKIKKQFQGKLLFSNDPLPPIDAADESGTIRTYKEKSTNRISGSDVDGVPTWTFHFLAFMQKPSNGTVSLDFYTNDKEKLFVAQERLTGIDKKITLLAHRVALSEDDGLTRGKTYTVKLTSKSKGKEVVLATGKFVAR